MAIICPNKNSKEFKDLAEQFGESLAESLSIRKGDIPSIQEAQIMVRGSKIAQFKKAVNYIENTTSSSVNDLMDNLFRIVHKVGNETYVVKGSRIDQNPAPLTQAEIHDTNRLFLQAINESYKGLFNITEATTNGKIDSIRNGIIEKIRTGQFDNLYGISYKRMAEDQERHNELLSEIAEEAKIGGRNRNDLEEALGSEIVNQVLEYDDLKNQPSVVSQTSTTYKVGIDPNVLQRIALDNIIRKEKENRNNPQTQKDAFDINRKVYNNEAPRYSRAYEQGVVGIVNHNLLNNLKRKFGIPFEVVNDNTVTWRGKFENGKVYINASNVTENTPIHEYMHPFTMVMQKDNPVLYNNLIDELQTTDLGKAVITEVEQNYPELSRKDQLDEALVTYISRIVNSNDIVTKPWYQRFIDWMKQIFSKNGFSIANLNMNMTINDLVEKIIDPAYTGDLKKYYDFNDAATKFSKTTHDQSERFEQLLDKIKTRLRLDISITPRTDEERTRKFFSGKQLALLEQNKDIFHAINDYVTSAIINSKNVSDRFDEFKKFYEDKKGKLNQEEVLKGMNLLSQIEQNIALYNESRFVIDAIREENEDEYEDNFKVLANRLNKDVKLINDYHQYGLKLMADWLYPHTEKTNQAAIKSGNKNKILGYDEYVKYKQDNPNMTDKEALEHGVKKYLMNQMEHATTDVGFFSSYMSGVINSNDAISQLIGISLKDEFSKNNSKLIKVRDGISKVVKSVIGTKVFTTNKQHKEFYSKYLREVNSYEKVGHDDNGNPIFDIVKRTGFIEEYDNDEFYNAKRKMFKDIGVRPNKSDTAAYAKWDAAKQAWFDKHTIKIVDAKGEIKIVPAAQYKNAQYDNVKNDPLYKELYKHYQDGNSKLGQYQLKYGIIPQVSLGGGLFSDLKISKGIKGNLASLKSKVKDQFAANVSSYYAQDIDGKEYKNVPIRFTRMVDEEDLNYNLAQTVGDFWESSAKYQTARTVEPMIQTLRNFIEGNSFLRIDERTVPEVDAKGVKKLGNFVKNLTKNKDQSNINRMLVDFVNDVIYGEAEKKSNIKSPFLNLKFLVYKDGDTSINGKPYKQYVYSIEDLKKITGNEDITVDNFVKGKEKALNNHKVTLLRSDKILSVNKLGKGVNTITSTIALGGNILAGGSNVLAGVAVNFVEATGGKYYNVPEFFAAFKDYTKAITNFDFTEDTKGGKGSKLSQLFGHYGIFMGEFANEYGKNIGSGVVNKLFRRSSLFLLLHAGEHLIQGTHMLATMRHVKVRDNITGKDINLLDAYEKGEDGYIKIKDGVNWTEEDDAKFRDTLQSLHKDKGNYSDFDKAALSRLWWGKMVLMFRRHIFNGIKARWGKEYIDYERGDAVQGYYRSFMTTLVSEINEFRLNGRFRKLTEDEAYNMKKTLAELGMFAILALVMVPAFKDDEPHQTGMNDYIALFSRRLQQDVSFFLNPLEWKKVIQSPVVTGSTIDKFYDFFSQIAVSPSEEYERDGFGYVSGDNKAMVKLKKLIPVYGKIMSMQSPQEILKFYDLKLPVKSGQ